MNNLSPATGNYLLEVSIEDLHWESRDWLSEIRAWQEEVIFYQKLLNKIQGRIKSEDAKAQWAHYQNILQEMLSNMLLPYQHSLEEHEEYLYNLVVNKAVVNDQFYREVHKKYANQVKAFSADFKQLKKKLFGFIEQAS